MLEMADLTARIAVIQGWKPRSILNIGSLYPTSLPFGSFNLSTLSFMLEMADLTARIAVAN